MDSLIITPNLRLARHLQQQFINEQIALGNKTWETPEIYALEHWLVKCWNDRHDPKILLTDVAEQILWKTIILDSGFAPFFLSSKIITLAKTAWEFIKQWQIDLSELHSFSEETANFKLWAAAFQQTCKQQNLLDKNSIIDELSTYANNANYTELEFPQRIKLVGFLEITPQLKTLLDILKAQQINIEISSLVSHSNIAKPSRISFTDIENEIISMASWAKQQLEINPKISIGCIVPNLNELRQDIIDIFSKTFRTDPIAPQHFNISLGKKLAEYPIINHAWQILQLSKKTIAIETLQNLLHSPFICGHDKEAGARSILASELANLPIQEISLKKIIKVERYFKQCPIFKNCLLRSLNLTAKFNQQYPIKTWAKFFSEYLACFYWPALTNASNIEYQLLQRFEKLLNEFVELQLFLPKISQQTALEHLNTLLTHTIFQPKTTAAPINILGLLEAAGLTFDSAWIMGMNDANIPSAARLNPFLPINLQRNLNMPHSSAQRELTFAKTLLETFKFSAKTIIYSYAENQDGHKLQVSPLITDAAIPEISTAELNITPYVDLPTKIFADKKIEIISEIFIPVTANEKTRGGSEILKSQALCPFQAFAKHRLNLKSLLQPKINFLRGSLAHAALEYFWQEVKSQENLIGLPDNTSTLLLSKCIALSLKNYGKGFFPREFLELERQFLNNLLKKWLDFEKLREPFSVVETEKSITANLSGVNIKLRIDRIDKLLNEDKFIIIDYKTGKSLPSIKNWFDERITDPQLPLYSIISEDIHGMVFVHLRPENTAKKLCQGLSAIKIATEFKTIDNWSELRQNWKNSLEKLAQDFALGKANLDPKDTTTCQQCEFAGLCRIDSTNS